MNITELIIGFAKGTCAARLAPNTSGVTIVRLEGAEPEALALAIRETLARPERTAAVEDVPFVCVTARSADLELSVADDAAARERVLTETHPAAMPLLLEAKQTQDERGEADLEALLARVAKAGGASAPELLFAALGVADLEGAGSSLPPGAGSSANQEPLSPEASAFLEAHRRALALSAQVRKLDDAMTASVVPDWIWIATGFGGVGVLLTVVALLYPELRVFILPALVTASLLVFTGYGLLASREMARRGRILETRRSLRAERQRARAEVERQAKHLEAHGVATASLIARSGGVERAENVPCLIGAVDVDEARAEALARIAATGRQVIVFTPASASLCPAARASLLEIQPA